MGLKLRLVRNGKVVSEWSLDPEDWPRERLVKTAQGLRREREELERFLHAFSNTNRWNLVCRMLDEEDFSAGFCDFERDLRLNSKIVHENLRRLQRLGFVDHERRGDYRLPELARLELVAAMRAMLDLLEAMRDEFRERR